MLRVELKKITCYRIKNRYSNTSHVIKQYGMISKGYSLQEGQCYIKSYNKMILLIYHIVKKGSDTGIKESQ